MLGKMDQRITFERAAETQDSIGDTIQTWAPLAYNPTVWARVFPASGREGMENARTTATAMTIFQIHNRTDLTEKDRIVWGDIRYNIRVIMRASTRDHYLKIEAERGVTQ